jgi:hypothetical protein
MLLSDGWAERDWTFLALMNLPKKDRRRLKQDEGLMEYGFRQGFVGD